MKKLMAWIALSLALASGHALAHESPAKHGGIVKSAGDMSFELVVKDNQVTIYIDDHGKDVPMAGGSGTLTVLQGTGKSEVPMGAGSGNTLVARTANKIGPGAKLVAAIVFPDKSAMSVRFSIK